MIEAYLRPVYNSLLVNPFSPLVAQRFTAKQITLAACVCGLLIFPALLLGLPIIATFFLFATGYLDTLDGAVARMTGTTSIAGNILDIISDRIVEFAIIFGLYAQDPLHRGWLALLMLGCCYLCITSVLVVRYIQPKTMVIKPGLIERAEAFGFFLLMIWFPDHFVILGLLFSSLLFLTSYLQIKDFIDADSLLV